MPAVFPFQAIRYDAGRFGGDLSGVLAPPYDVLDEPDKRALLARSEHNIAAVDLPFIPPKSAGPPAVYRQAAERLRGWLGEKVLIREASPSIYAYHQRFTHEGRGYTRKMFIAALRLAAFSERTILPHEQTFGGPKEDRLALMKASRCQLSPIFGLYTDPTGEAARALAAVAEQPPSATGTVEGVQNQVWVVSDSAVIRRVSDALRDKTVYIADGHHRYGTALIYRDWLREQEGGKLTDDHPANFIMFVLSSMDDPGCLILPYHRVLAGIGVDEVVRAWAAGTKPAEANAADIRLWDAKSGREVSLSFTLREVLRKLAPGRPDAWYDLDYAYLHTYLIDDLFARAARTLQPLPYGSGSETRAAGHPPKIHYVKSTDQAKQTARDEGGVALLMNATKMSQLRAVSEAGGLMPQKSTYFHPKLATGVALNPLD